MAIWPVRATSRIPNSRKSSKTASIFSRSPVISIIRLRRPTSTIRARKISAISRNRERSAGSTATRTRQSSRATDSVGSRSTTFTTSTSFCSCLSTCSMTRSSPSMTMVIRESRGSSVTPTVKLSMLKPRRAKRPATRESTPGWFSTITANTCRTMPPPSCLRPR